MQMIMECPYLEMEKASRVCAASVTRMEPRVVNAGAYCETEDHYRCPTLLGHVLRSGSKTFRAKH